jgi:cyclophilin family peptidyl-prolyl cis-trans isomerase/HEAT repeat protein
MPKQASVSRRPTPRSSPSTRTAAPRHFRTTSARSWNLRSSAAFVALLVAATACRSIRSTAPDARVGLRADLIRIEDTRRLELAPLDSALASPDPALRSAAALTVGRIGARQRAAALRTLATDANEHVAGAALYALGLLKDTASVPVAAAALRGAPGIAAEAAWMLGEVGEPGRAALLGALPDASLGARRGPTLLALARVKGVPSAPLVSLLSDADTAIAWRAAYTLARVRTAAAASAMMRATHTSSVDVRDYATRGLARSLTGDSLGQSAQQRLRELVRDSSARVRTTAVRVLAGYGAGNGPALAEALRDSDANVRITAASFAHLVLDTTSAAWLAVWRSDSSLTFRRALAEAGLRRGALRELWKPWRDDPVWQLRAAAAELDGLGPATEAITRLERPLRDDDGRVRAAAAGALATLAESASVAGMARRELRALARDPDFVVRANALGALARNASTEDLAIAIASYPLPDSLARALSAIERPSDPLERSRAASISRFAFWRDSTGTARPQSWYEARARESLDGRTRSAQIVTNRGTLVLELFPAEAPITVDNFASLARKGYFDGQAFHRVVPNFVVQAGDPRGDGNGGPGYAIRDELNPHRYGPGALGMALSGPNTGGSQFFVTHSAQPHLDGGYTVFGQLRGGRDVLDRIVQGDRIVRITIQ